jgi:hypothetical protein
MYQEWDLNRTDYHLASYSALAKIYKGLSDEGHAELQRLKGGN